MTDATTGVVYTPNDEPYRWLSIPRWYLWEGGFLAIGQAGGEVPPHSHHAIQIFLALAGTAAIRRIGGEWREGRGIIVRPDVEHSFNGRGASGAMLFVDPESSEGAWLQTGLAADIWMLIAFRLVHGVLEAQADGGLAKLMPLLVFSSTQTLLPGIAETSITTVPASPTVRSDAGDSAGCTTRSGLSPGWIVTCCGSIVVLPSGTVDSVSV